MKTNMIWIGPPPSHCDICKEEIKYIFIDGRTKYGLWASLCTECAMDADVRLGTGSGQAYKLDAITGIWNRMEFGKEKRQI